MHIIEYKFSQIFKYMGFPEEKIRPEASFVADFDFEEFQFNCLVFYIGSYFKINIREGDYAELNTIGSAMNFVKRKLEVNSHF
jgi:acyl carrier protein